MLFLSLLQCVTMSTFGETSLNTVRILQCNDTATMINKFRLSHSGLERKVLSFGPRDAFSNEYQGIIDFYYQD